MFILRRIVPKLRRVEKGKDNFVCGDWPFYGVSFFYSQGGGCMDNAPERCLNSLINQAKTISIHRIEGMMLMKFSFTFVLVTAVFILNNL